MSTSSPDSISTSSSEVQHEQPPSLSIPGNTFVTSDETVVVTEGSASILFPKGNKVFYNPVQQFNRDLSTLGIRAWSNLYSKKGKPHSKSLKENTVKRENSPPLNDTRNKKICLENETTKSDQSGDQEETKLSEIPTIEESETPAILTEEKPQRYLEIIEALSATGLRAIRYASEIPTAKTVYANDFSASAVESIRKNAEYSKVGSVIVPNHGDANIFMYSHKRKPVHVVDLDPYGSATPFIDAAIQSIRDGGLLLVTCTDLSVLAGNGYPEKCFAQYGGQTLYSDACHESALRLVLHMISNTAARYGIAIEPLLSLSIDFYVRLFIRVKKSPSLVKYNASYVKHTYSPLFLSFFFFIKSKVKLI